MSPPAVPPKTPEISSLEKSAHDFLATHKKWANFTLEEIHELRTRDFKLGTAALKKKNVVSDTYQRQLKFLHEHREELAKLPKDLIASLRTAQGEFAKLGDELQIELGLTSKLVEQFMNLIRRSLNRQLQTSQFYGRSGTLVKSDITTPVTVNKKA